MNVSRSSLLPYSVKKMYNVIVNVRSYPEFLNWCSGMEIISENDDEIVAKLIISYGKLKFSFTTRNTMIENRQVRIELVKGPFSKLSGQWTLYELSDSACKVSLEMNFKFDNIIAQKLLGRAFQSIIAAQLDAFHNRAQELYADPISTKLLPADELGE